MPASTWSQAKPLIYSGALCSLPPILKGDCQGPLSFPFGNIFIPPLTREDLAPPELRPASICTVSGVFSPEKQYISKKILLMHCLVDNLGIYLIGHILEQGYLQPKDP